MQKRFQERQDIVVIVIFDVFLKKNAKKIKRIVIVNTHAWRIDLGSTQDGHIYALQNVRFDVNEAG